MIYRIDRANNKIIQLPRTNFSSEGFKEVKNIEEWIMMNPNLLADEEDSILIIDRQRQTETRKRLDLLGLGIDGNLVIIELKRDFASTMTDFQAIQYAASISKYPLEKAYKNFAEYLRRHITSLSDSNDLLETARTRIHNFLGSPEETEEKFNSDQRIILIAGEFSADLLSACEWLIFKGIDITCIQLILYKSEGELFLHPVKILPTEEISYNVGLKIGKTRESERRSERKKYHLSMEDHFSRLNESIGENLRNLVESLAVEPINSTQTGFHLVSGGKKVMISTYVKSKVEIRFSPANKDEVQELIAKLDLTRLELKPKADIQSYSEKPIPAIDCIEKFDFEDMIKLCQTWLEL